MWLTVSFIHKTTHKAQRIHLFERTLFGASFQCIFPFLSDRIVVQWIKVKPVNALKMRVDMLIESELCKFVCVWIYIVVVLCYLPFSFVISFDECHHQTCWSLYFNECLSLTFLSHSPAPYMCVCVVIVNSLDFVYSISLCLAFKKWFPWIPWCNAVEFTKRKEKQFDDDDNKAECLLLVFFTPVYRLLISTTKLLDNSVINGAGFDYETIRWHISKRNLLFGVCFFLFLLFPLCRSSCRE